MRLLLAGLLFLAAGMLDGCADTSRFGDTVIAMPAVPPDKARLYFYRELEQYESLTMTTVYLNGQAVGASANGSVFYRDVPPGIYEVEVLTRGVYPNQFKTVAVEAGHTTFVKIESLMSWIGMGLTPKGDTYVVAIVSPELGRREILGLRFAPG